MANARERIVVIESDVATRDTLQAAMQGAGYDATTFAASQEGLDAIHATGADLLLLDSRMPDLSAREAIATIRGSAATEALRVILLVGPSAEERAAAIDLGADDAISRPWESSELLSRVRSQFRAQRAEAQLRAKARIAEEGQQIAHTAFEALAVT
jgi:DNA-binding response OmpR family regulator